jgi:hypothetical protein
MGSTVQHQDMTAASFQNVRFGSKADIGASVKDVRFTPKSGHQLSNASSIASASSALAYNPAAYHPLNQLVLKQRLGGGSIHSDLTYMKITDRRFALGCGIGYAVYRVKKATGSIRLIR